MHIVGIDKDGNQRCWWCGGQEFTRARVTPETIVLGVPVATAKPTLRCAHCGEHNDAALTAFTA